MSRCDWKSSDVLRRTIAVLADGPHGEGMHQVEVGTHEIGHGTRGLAAGVYLVRLRADGRTQTRKLTVVR